MARQIVVDLVSDSKDFEKSMQGAGKATEKFERKLKDTDSTARDFHASWDQAGDAFDTGESRLIGTADLLDGLAVTMGGVSSESVDMLRGFGDIASGVTNALVPALAAGTAKVKAMSAAMIATPGGRVKLAMAVAAVGIGAAAAEAGQLQKVWKFVSNEIVGDAIRMGNKLVGMALSVVGAAESAIQSLEDLEKQGKQISGMDSLRGPAGGGISVDDLRNWHGNTTGSNDWSGRNKARQFVKGLQDTLEAAHEKLAEAAKEGAQSLGETWSDELKRALTGPSPLQKLNAGLAEYQRKVTDALNKFNQKVQAAKGMREGFRKLFRFDVGSTDYRNVPAGLRSQVSRWKRFVAVFAQLRRKGLHPSLLQAFADAGPAALEEMNKVNAASIRDINKLTRQGLALADEFALAETRRRTGVDLTNIGKAPKVAPVKVTLDVKGGDKELVNLIKKWVRVEGGGNVQVAFGKK